MFVCPACGQSGGAAGFCTEDGTALADASNDPLLGQTVGAYRLARVLGRGGMGAVYLGAHPGIGSRVAVKVLNPGAAESPALVERFFAEARAVNVIRHESIVNVLDLAQLPDGRPYIVMECLEGAPLAAHFAAHRPFPLDVLARLGIGVAGALAAAHAAGITHRDLKPDNVFVTTLGMPKVLDFGIAKLRPEQGGNTHTGALLGTPHYMSPEQAQGHPVDPRSDLYSLGVILFEGATGRVPFEGPALYEVLHQHVSQAPPPPRSARPDLPPAFEAVILRLLAKRREDRFQSAAELSDALAHLLPELPQTRSLPAPPLLSSLPPLTPTPGMLPPAVAAPTFAATSHTIGGGSRPPTAAPPNRKSNALLLVLGGALAVIVLLGLGTGIFVLGWFAMSGTTTAATPTAAPSAGSAAGGPAATSGAKDRFDAVAWLPQAKERARKHLPDAELYNLAVTFPGSDGTVVFDDMMVAVAYTFRSPSASRGTGHRKCLVSVSVSMNGKFDSVVEDSTCDQPTVAAPRCSLARATAKIHPGSAIMSVTYRAGSGGVFQWIISQRNGAMSIVPDDC